MVEDLIYVYTPERIRSILRQWAAYVASEESPHAAAGLFVRGPTKESPKISGKGRHGDPMSGVAVVADVRRAFLLVYADDLASLEAITVQRVSEGWGLNRIARVQMIGAERTWRAFNTATEKMATVLGWRDTVHSE